MDEDILYVYYKGERSSMGGAGTVKIHSVNLSHSEIVEPLNPRNDLFDHSQDGFNWGYGGSGPAQLALAIAADVIGDDEQAVAIHQALKFRVIARIADNNFILFKDELAETISALFREREERERREHTR